MIYVVIVYVLLSWLFLLLLHRSDLIVLKSGRNDPYKILFFVLPLLVVGFYFVALRPFNAGGDTVAYLQSFARISSPLTSTIDSGYGTEFLFWPVQALFKCVVSQRGWLIVNYFIVVMLSYYAYVKITEGSKVTPYIFALIFLSFFAVYTGNAMRQVYSIPIGLVAFHYCFRREYLKFTVLAAISIGFHWAAMIILITPLFVAVPNRRHFYVLVPVCALLCSQFIGVVVDFVLNITGFEWLAFKSDIYFKGGQSSYIVAVWKTMNFWLCILLYVLLVFTRIVVDVRYEEMAKYFLMFMSMMLFSVGVPDVSERYMVWYLFLIPFGVVALVLKLRVASVFKNVVLLVLFGVMGGMVFTRESAMHALGVAL